MAIAMNLELLERNPMKVTRSALRGISRSDTTCLPNYKEDEINMLKKLLAISVSAVLVVTVLGGCGKTEKQTSTGVDSNKISVEVFDFGNIPASEGTMANNRWTKWINEQSGVDVTWISIDRNSNQQKMNALLAAGSAPDLIIEYDRSYIASLVNQGVLAPVSDFVNKYSTVYKDYIAQNSDLQQYTNFGGKDYAFTSKRDSTSIANNAMWIRQDWLDKLGLKMPTTDEELFNVAKAFTENDPDGNGKKDTFGFAMVQWEEAFPAFYFANALWYNENGVAKFGSTVDRYKDSLSYISRLYKAGAIDPEFFTDKTRQQQQQLWDSGRAGIIINNWGGENNRNLITNVPNAKPVPLAAISTKYGTNGLWQETAASMYVGMNKDIKNPQAAIKFIDWMMDKGWFTLSNGFENVHYKLDNGVPKIIDVEKNKTELSYANYGLLGQPKTSPEMIRIQAPSDMLSQELARESELGLVTAMSHKFRRDFPCDPSDPDVNNVTTEFWPKRDEIRINVITGKVSPDEGYKQIVDAWKSMGGENAEKKALEFYKNAGLMK